MTDRRRRMIKRGVEISPCPAVYRQAVPLTLTAELADGSPDRASGGAHRWLPCAPAMISDPASHRFSQFVVQSEFYCLPHTEGAEDAENTRGSVFSPRPPFLRVLRVKRLSEHECTGNRRDLHQFKKFAMCPLPRFHSSAVPDNPCPLVPRRPAPSPPPARTNLLRILDQIRPTPYRSRKPRRCVRQRSSSSAAPPASKMYRLARSNSAMANPSSSWRAR
jgi:hypothetical protein